MIINRASRLASALLYGGEVDKPRAEEMRDIICRTVFADFDNSEATAVVKKLLAAWRILLEEEKDEEEGYADLQDICLGGSVAEEAFRQAYLLAGGEASEVMWPDALPYIWSNDYDLSAEGTPLWLIITAAEVRAFQDAALRRWLREEAEKAEIARDVETTPGEVKHG